MKAIHLGTVALGLVLAGCASDPDLEATKLSSHASSVEEGWVQMFDGKDYTGPRLTVKYPRDIAKLEDVHADHGAKGFEDKPSSVKWCIPKGWSVILYEDPIFNGDQTELKGNGDVQQIHDLDKHNGRENQASSIRWIKNQD